MIPLAFALFVFVIFFTTLVPSTHKTCIDSNMAILDNLYNEIIIVGTHRAPSIKVAEAAKVIENTQRDLNIALINELSMLFNKLNIDTEAVLKAAESKWNFLPLAPRRFSATNKHRAASIVAVSKKGGSDVCTSLTLAPERAGFDS